MNSPLKYLVFTDGACLGNPGPGGWGYLIRPDGTQSESEGAGGEPNTTNNRMELQAVIEALTTLDEGSRVEIYSDSKYVIDGFEKGWIQNWKKNGWKTANKKPVKNKELWEKLYEKIQQFTVTWQWVKGHSGHRENEIVDQLAREAAEKI